MRKLALSLTFSLVFFSCEKDNQLIIENTDIPLISKVIIAGESYYEYLYNDANLVTEEKSKFHYTRHIYNDKNQLTKSDFYWDMSMASSDSHVSEAAMNRKEWVNPFNTVKSMIHAFDYNENGQLIRKTYIRLSDSNSEYNEFTYENDRISRKTMYWQNAISYYIDNVYDENGNLIKESKYRVSPTGVSELWTTTEYEYDNMQNPYQSFKRLMNPGRNTNQNNITKETYTIHFEADQWTEKVQITEYTYDYNVNRYPIRVNGEAEYVYK